VSEIDQLNDDLEKENTISETDFYKMDENYVRFKFKLETPQLNLAFFNEYN
jgi:hypothetical protein